jgi:hypothetical protein
MLFHFLVALVLHDLHKADSTVGANWPYAHFLNRGGLTLLGCVDPEGGLSIVRFTMLDHELATIGVGTACEKEVTE